MMSNFYINQKKQAQSELEEDIEKFLAQGGAIQKIPAGESAIDLKEKFSKAYKKYQSPENAKQIELLKNYEKDIHSR